MLTETVPQSSEQLPRDRSDRDWSDQQLQLCRRLDWRFLLQDATLRRVVYYGASSDLLEALRAFAVEVKSFLPREQGIASPEEEETADVAVLVHPTVAQVAAAHRWLRPGGEIYLECRGPMAALTIFQKWRGLRGVREHLRLAGFSEVEAYWPWPWCRGAREFLPLTDPAAAASYFRRCRPGRLGRLKSAFGTRILRLGLLPYLALDVSVIARRP